MTCSFFVTAADEYIVRLIVIKFSKAEEFGNSISGITHNEDIREAIHLDTQVSHKNKANKKDTTTFMHYLYCPAEYNGAPFIAKITVEEYDVGGKRRAYNAQRIKMSSLPRAHFSQLNNEAKTRKIRLQDDEIMISDLFSIVKQYDKSFKPDLASEIVNEDGTPKVVYHGSYSNFTIFDKNAGKHSKSPIDGKNNFDTYDKFRPDAEVVITYHTLKKNKPK